MLVSLICDLLFNSNGICTEFNWLGRDPRSASTQRIIKGKYVGVKLNLRISKGACTECTGWDATDGALQHTRNV